MMMSLPSARVPSIGDLVRVDGPGDYQALKVGDVGRVAGYPWADKDAFIGGGILVNMLGQQGDITYRNVSFYPTQIKVID